MELNEVLDTLEGMLASHEGKKYEALLLAINCVKAYMLEMLCRKTAMELAQQQTDTEQILLEGVPNEIADRIRAGFTAPPNNM